MAEVHEVFLQFHRESKDYVTLFLNNSFSSFVCNHFKEKRKGCEDDFFVHFKHHTLSIIIQRVFFIIIIIIIKKNSSLYHYNGRKKKKKEKDL